MSPKVADITSSHWKTSISSCAIVEPRHVATASCKGNWKLLYLGAGVWWQGGHHLWATSCLCRCGPGPQTAKWRSSYMTHSMQWPSLSPAQPSSLTTARKLTLAKGQQSLGVLLSQSQDHLLQAWLAFARRLLRCSSLVSAITLHVSA